MKTTNIDDKTSNKLLITGIIGWISLGSVFMLCGLLLTSKKAEKNEKENLGFLRAYIREGDAG